MCEIYLLLFGEVCCNFFSRYVGLSLDMYGPSIKERNRLFRGLPVSLSLVFAMCDEGDGIIFVQLAGNQLMCHVLLHLCRDPCVIVQSGRFGKANAYYCNIVEDPLHSERPHIL